MILGYDVAKFSKFKISHIQNYQKSKLQKIKI